MDHYFIISCNWKAKPANYDLCSNVAYWLLFYKTWDRSNSCIFLILRGKIKRMVFFLLPSTINVWEWRCCSGSSSLVMETQAVIPLVWLTWITYCATLNKSLHLLCISVCISGVGSMILCKVKLSPPEHSYFEILLLCYYCISVPCMAVI